MRHGNKVKKLGRNASHRKATMAALSGALIRHKRITTTLAKAKALRGFVEPILHRAKDDSTHSRRLAFRSLGNDKEAVKELFSEVAGAVGDRPGGYTRVVKLGQRPGDAAEMAVIEIVDFNDVKPEGAAATKRKTRRSRRRTSGDATSAAAAPKAAKPASKGPDDLTKIVGIGPAFAKALDAAGIRTYDQLARADLYTLRDAIQEHSKVSDEQANEETWAAQAAFAARGEWDAMAAYAEEAKAAGNPEPEPADDATEAGGAAAAPPEDQKAEAAASDAENPNQTGNPQVPQHPKEGDHRDMEQGAAPGTGEPPPEAHRTNLGRSGHRG